MNEKVYDYADDLISKAVMFASSAHSGQFRKDGKTPAMIHAMETATIAASISHDMNIMAAAMLHDTVEDTDVTPEQILRMFGERVAFLVASETEDKHPEMSKESSWIIRKEESIKELREATDIAVKILWLSDKLSNMRSFYRMYRAKGDEMWQAFNQKDKSKHEWYYRSIADAVIELSDTAAYEEYIDLVNKVFTKE